MWPVLRAIRDWFSIREPAPEELLSGSLKGDLILLKRFSGCRKEEVHWREPTVAEAKQWDDHPVLGRYADTTDAVATVGGQTWIVRSRLFNGWPDPPEWVFFALEGDGVWAAGDFDAWPRRWTKPQKAMDAT